MNPRVNYEMTEADLEKILDACKPTPVLFISGGQNIGGSPQENANRAWQELGQRMGFDHMTVRPAPGGNRFFTAVPNETDEQRTERLNREADERKQSEIQALQKTISEASEKLEALLKLGNRLEK